MRAPLSIIIPTLNTAPALALVLGALGEGLQAGLIREVIISDGGSKDATRDLAVEAGARFVSGAPGRGGQLRRGAAAAEGPWLLFLHADTLLAPGWSAAVLAHLGQETAAYFRLGFQAEGGWPRFVAGWANVRSRAFGLPYGDQGLLISAALYRSVGGYADIPLMEDVAMARALKGQMTALPATALTSAERYLQGGWFWRGARNLWTLGRYLMGADPARLAVGYRRK